MRQIPLVNGLLDWIAPLDQTKTSSGRTFNLQSGKIANTDVIYKYHMQVEQTDQQAETSVLPSSSTVLAESLVSNTTEDNRRQSSSSEKSNITAIINSSTEEPSNQDAAAASATPNNTNNKTEA